jgi:NMD protein affecting ribosome stability and mRNA decay
MAFCPGCGISTEKGFCDKCRPRSELRIRDIDIKVCASCRKFFHRNKWMASGSIEEAVSKVVKDFVKDKYDVKPILPDYSIGPGSRVDFEVELTNDDDFVVPGQLFFTYCDICSKKQGKYFEGTLQLRKVNDEVLDFAESYIESHNMFIAEKRKTEDGFDLDISDQRKLQTLGQALHKAFGGDLKVSVRQFTHNRLTSKQVYRVNVLYVPPDYKKGDVVKLESGLYLITNVRKNISAIDLKTGKKATLNFKKDYLVLKPVKTTVSKIYPALEIFDPETYQSVPAVNRKKVTIGEKVKIVNDEGLFYII